MRGYGVFIGNSSTRVVFVSWRGDRTAVLLPEGGLALLFPTSEGEPWAHLPVGGAARDMLRTFLLDGWALEDALEAAERLA